MVVVGGHEPVRSLDGAAGKGTDRSRALQLFFFLSPAYRVLSQESGVQTWAVRGILPELYRVLRKLQRQLPVFSQFVYLLRLP